MVHHSFKLMNDIIILIKTFHDLTNKYTLYNINNMYNFKNIYADFKI